MKHSRDAESERQDIMRRAEHLFPGITDLLDASRDCEGLVSIAEQCEAAMHPPLRIVTSDRTNACEQGALNERP